MSLSQFQVQQTVELFDSFVRRSSRHGSHQVNHHLKLLVAELIGTDDIRFFDWSPTPTAIEGARMAGHVTLITEQEIVHVQYREVDYFVDQTSASSAGNAEVTVVPLRSARSVSVRYEEVHRERAAVSAGAFVIEGDGWSISLPNFHVLSDQFDRLTELRRVLFSSSPHSELH